MAAAGLALWLGSSLAVASVEAGAWAPCERIDAPQIDECSGIVPGRLHPDVLWVHNDSGDTARLFAIDRAGHLVREVRVRGARNVDWEDIAADDSGHLYLADTGNNRNKRRDLGIYVIDEPDPHAPGAPAPLEVPALRHIPFHFPDQRAFPDTSRLNFDCEALFWNEGWLYVLTKHRSDTRTALYRIDPRAAAEQAALRLGGTEIGSLVTGADMSRDGRLLLVLSYQYIHVFQRPPHGDNWLAGRRHRMLIEGRQCEGICLDGETVLFTNEQREMYCMPLAYVRTHDRYLPAPPVLDVPGAPGAMAGSSQGGRDVAVPLVFEATPGDDGVAVAGAAPAPAIRAAWSPEGLRLTGMMTVPDSLRAPGRTLLYVMLGSVGDMGPRLSRGQLAWEGKWADGGVELRLVAGVPVSKAARGRILAARCAARDSTLSFEALLPTPSGRPLRAGGEILFGVVVLEPRGGGDAASEWYWPASLTTQPLENPLLWARLRLRAP